MDEKEIIKLIMSIGNDQELGSEIRKYYYSKYPVPKYTSDVSANQLKIDFNEVEKK